MSLYLCIFDDDDDIDGVQVGHYEDFGEFRDLVTSELEGSVPGSKYPTLILHSDCDGCWSPTEAAKLEGELMDIQARFSELAPRQPSSQWKKLVWKNLGLTPKNLNESLYDVDGDPLIDGIIRLARLSQKLQLPILFQ